MSMLSRDEITSDYDPAIKEILPHSKMYTLQIGNERFVLSGASLSSDAPSYFTNYFSNSANANQVLFIDRSPEIFKYIYQHLQGYYVDIEGAEQFTGLFSDALYYNLPQLRKTLLGSDYYYANVGGDSIKVAKKLLDTPGNSPNFFTMAYDSLYADITEIIKDMNWIRPPPQAAPKLSRCSILFKELVNVLQGVEPEIRSPEHRRSLIKEAKYYRFNGLIEKLTGARVVYNPFQRREELAISLEHIDIRCLVQASPYVQYKRLYTEESPRVLVVKVEDPEITLIEGKYYVNGRTKTFMKRLFGEYLYDESNLCVYECAWPQQSDNLQDCCIEQCILRLRDDRTIEIRVKKFSSSEQQWMDFVLF
jgi:hypothetical protein